MGGWTEFCCLCGLPLEAIPENETITKWMDDVLVITSDKQCAEPATYDGYGMFDGANNDEKFHVTGFGKSDDESRECFSYHRCCYELLVSNRLGQFTQFKVLKTLSRQRATNHIIGHPYGGASKYHMQMFDYGRCVREGNEWMTEDPLVTERNSERILSIWEKYASKRR